MSQEMIRSGIHREAVFWIVATYTRCHKILAADAPVDIQQVHAPAFDEVLRDLGIATQNDLMHQAERTLRFLPKVWETAEAIMRDNPRIGKM